MFFVWQTQRKGAPPSQKYLPLQQGRPPAKFRQQIQVVNFLSLQRRLYRLAQPSAET
jgi:hypothetical protein